MTTLKQATLACAALVLIPSGALLAQGTEKPPEKPADARPADTTEAAAPDRPAPGVARIAGIARTASARCGAGATGRSAVAARRGVSARARGSGRARMSIVAAAVIFLAGAGAHADRERDGEQAEAT